MIKNTCFGLVFFILIIELSLAEASSITKVVALSAGPSRYRAGQSETIFLQPETSNRYMAQTPEHTLASGELFFGAQRPFLPIGFVQLGLAIVATNAAQLQGDIWETADPLFDNFSYQYKITHSHLAIKTKWLFNHWSNTVLPYLSASIGVARNKSYDFSMQPLIFEVLPGPGFQAKQKMALTYTMGLGLQKILSKHWQLGVGYEFSDWGASSLNRMPGQTIDSGLYLAHLYSHQLQCNITFLL
jgi:hypothetical protein